jgi:hypothetical protein
MKYQNYITIDDFLDKKSGDGPDKPKSENAISMYTPLEWQLLQLAFRARKYNLAVLRGQVQGKGHLKAEEDLRTAQYISNGITNGKRYNDPDAKQEIKKVTELLYRNNVVEAAKLGCYLK